MQNAATFYWCLSETVFIGDTYWLRFVACLFSFCDNLSFAWGLTAFYTHTTELNDGDGAHQPRMATLLTLRHAHAYWFPL